MTGIFIGMAGWSYEGWRGSFYPEGLKQKDELAHASRRIHSIEVNGTFYSLFRPNSYLSWYAETPADFNFSLKGPKYITHERRLKDFQTPLANFLASGILALREKLGCILWQFPPTLPFTRERFEPFFAALPHDMKTAAALGQGHSSWLEGRTYLDASENHRLRHAVEGRHPSFRDPAFVELAKQYGIAIVVGDTAGRWPLIEDVATDFLYLRLHADETKYPDGYTKEGLEYWGARIKIWSQGSQPEDAALVVNATPTPEPRRVFAYFDNDVKETAPLNALSMITLLQQNGILMERVRDEWQPIIKEMKAAKASRSAKVNKAAEASNNAEASENAEANNNAGASENAEARGRAEARKKIEASKKSKARKKIEVSKKVKARKKAKASKPSKATKSSKASKKAKTRPRKKSA